MLDKSRRRKHVNHATTTSTTRSKRRKSTRRLVVEASRAKASLRANDSSASSSPSPPPADQVKFAPSGSTAIVSYSLDALTSLPSFDSYQAQVRGRTPFECTRCGTNFSRTTIVNHIRTRHRGAKVDIVCQICSDVFAQTSEALDHFASYHKIYDCFQCSQNFSRFEKLRSHLKGDHNSDWPWICGYCDQPQHYELDFQIHIRQHTEQPPFHCPLCVKGRPFVTTDELQKHVAEEHLPRSNEAEMTSTETKSEVTTAAEARDENAVNREIAALLLNLHASRSNDAMIPQKAEDLSLKTETAMDLSTGKADRGSLDLSKNSNATSSSYPTPPSQGSGGVSSANPYSFYPSLASMASMNPNYFLQNLLQLGKMQQHIAAAASTSSTASSISSAPSSSLSFPTQPLPAQALSIPSVPSSGAPKPPSTVLKSPLPNGNSSSSSNSSGVNGMPQMPDGTPAKNIPYLCGQIVAQLNGLLYLVHSLNNAQVEVSLQTQLSAIYMRLQEVVTMVEQTKKAQQDDTKLSPKALKDSKLREEEKIAKHIQDYQRALMQQHDQGKSSSLPSQIAPLKESPASNSVVNLLKKQAQANLDAKGSVDLTSYGQQQLPEVESTSGMASSAARRRRGRPPKNSNLDLSYSPPDKRPRNSTDHNTSPNGAESTTSSLVANGNGLTGDVVGTKTGSGKGIRNRVFCGECAGCLKNDDCGRCRYCQDKTKFGGQNRLRQKCLHRRCQMDTHRKRNSAGGNSAAATAAAAATNKAAVSSTGASANIVSSSSFKETLSARQSPSPNTIYSGVDLARLAATAAAVETVANAERMEENLKEVDGVQQENGEKPDAKLNIGEKDSHDEVKPEDIDEDNGPIRRSTRSRQKSTDDGVLQSRMASISDEESEEGDLKGHSGQRSQSRIDKWKAKHEAMLKLAQEGKKKGKTNNKAKAKMDEEELLQDEDVLEEPESPEIPNIDPNGVCIDLDGDKSEKPHTRHNAAVQQALSV